VLESKKFINPPHFIRSGRFIRKMDIKEYLLKKQKSDDKADIQLRDVFQL
jgi:hypothetical protein